MTATKPPMPASQKQHWETIYQSKSPTDVSWFQPQPTQSLAMIQYVASNRAAHIADIGSGTTTLISALLDAGYTNISAIDIAATALSVAQSQLGERVSQVRWIEADVTRLALPAQSVDVWHDRAVFHFLTRTCDR